MRRHLVVLTVATVAVVAVSYVGWKLPADTSPDRFRTPGDRTSTDASTAALDPGPRGAEHEVVRLIGAYERQVADRPTSTSLTFLGQLYLARAKLTGDAPTYVRAKDALQQAVALFPSDLDAQALLASAQATLHDFPTALASADAVLAKNGSQYAALATAGDARLELGDYDGAAGDYRRLADALPHVAAVDVRQARLAFLRGRVAEARRFASDAEAEARAAGVGGSGLAFYEVFRSQLDLDSGRYDDALLRARQAVGNAGDWHVAQAQLGKALAATGDRTGAIRAYQRAIAIVPQPDYLAALGDLQTVQGDRTEARRQYDTVAFIGRLSALNRQLYNRQFALFDADHRRAPESAVRLARTELDVRKDIYGWDAYAWALYAAGHADEAAAAVPHALALGTADPRLLYHAGMIAAANGDTTRARSLLGRALTLSPRFDPLQAPRAGAELARLGGS